jgi:hypothetical protein
VGDQRCSLPGEGVDARESGEHDPAAAADPGDTERSSHERRRSCGEFAPRLLVPEVDRADERGEDPRFQFGLYLRRGQRVLGDEDGEAISGRQSVPLDGEPALVDVLVVGREVDSLLGGR